MPLLARQLSRPGPGILFTDFMTYFILLLTLGYCELAGERFIATAPSERGPATTIKLWRACDGPVEDRELTSKGVYFLLTNQHSP